MRSGATSYGNFSKLLDQLSIPVSASWLVNGANWLSGLFYILKLAGGVRVGL